MTPRDRQRLRRLFSAALDDRLNPDERQELAERLEDPVVAREWADYSATFASLALHAQDVECGVRHSRSAAIPGRHSSWQAWAIAAGIILAVAVGASLLLSHAWDRHDRLTRPVQYFATLVDARDAVFEKSDVPTSPGSQLPGGFLRIASGEVDIEFFSGAQVTITGPATFGINAQKRGFLEHGKLSAYCPPGARGFTIGAPGVAVVDLGTRFKMRVDRMGASHVQVTEGLVALQTSGADPQNAHLAAGTQSWITARGQMKQDVLVDEDAPVLAAHYPMAGSLEPRAGFPIEDPPAVLTPAAGPRDEPGGSLHFDGASPLALEGLWPSDEYSVCAWIRPQRIDATRYIVGVQNSAFPGGRFLRIVDGQVEVQHVSSSSSTSIASVRYPVAADRWTHVAATFALRNPAHGELRLYVNGELVGMQAVTAESHESYINNLTIGARPDRRNQDQFVGQISDLRIYDEAVSQRDIRALIESF